MKYFSFDVTSKELIYYLDFITSNIQANYESALKCLLTHTHTHKYLELCLRIFLEAYITQKQWISL
jgi:hypothetical protein